MLAKFLVPENIARTDGIGPDIDLAVDRGKLLVITLGIDRVLEQEALTISIWGSSDTSNWDVGPLMSFPSKYYCGVYSRLLNLAEHPNVRYLRIEWKVSRWGKGEITPLFGFYVFAEGSGARVRGATAIAAAAISSDRGDMTSLLQNRAKVINSHKAILLPNPTQ
jgi:hypothetical protein